MAAEAEAEAGMALVVPVAQAAVARAADALAKAAQAEEMAVVEAVEAVEAAVEVECKQLLLLACTIVASDLLYPPC